MIKKLKHTFILFGFIMLTITCCFLLSACDNKQDQDYIINFIVDKQLYYNTIVSNNKSIVFPEEPYKNGYSFEGWYYIQNYQEIKFDTDYLKNNKLTKDLNIYAKFKAKDLTVLLNLNGGACEMQTISVSYGKSFSLPTPTRNGYDFDGWYLTDEDEIIENTIWDYDTTTLVAKWKQIFDISGNKIVGVTQYGKTLEHIEIPETIDNENIVYLNSNSFAGCTNLKNIVIPNSIKEIGIGTFYDCSNLKEITIPFVGDTESSDNTFGYIFGTQKYIGSTETIQNKISYYIPTTLTKVIITGGSIVKPSAFCNCTNLTDIYIKNAITIGSSAFAYCSSLENVILPKTLTSIQSSAFYNCSNLENIIIPDNVSSISNYSFSNCVNLKNINIPDNVSSIGDSAFCNCSNLEEITIPKNVSSIGDEAFYNCINVTKLYYNAINCADIAKQNSYTTTTIRFYHLGENTSGTELYIGKNVKRIPARLFLFSSNKITKIEFEKNSQCSEIGEYTFDECNNLKYILFTNSINIKRKSLSTGYYNIYCFGTEEEYLSIECPYNATKYYYSETQPQKSGNYWHYDTENKTILIWE